MRWPLSPTSSISAPRTGFLTLFGLALAVRLVILPVALYGTRLQEEHSEKMRQMQPEISQIERELSGMEKHEALMALYKRHQVSPLAGLKLMIPLAIQIPFFIVVYHVLSAESRLQEVSFLWAESLAAPDRLFQLPFALRFLEPISTCSHC